MMDLSSIGSLPSLWDLANIQTTPLKAAGGLFGGIATLFFGWWLAKFMLKTVIVGGSKLAVKTSVGLFRAFFKSDLAYIFPSVKFWTGLPALFFGISQGIAENCTQYPVGTTSHASLYYGIAGLGLSLVCTSFLTARSLSEKGV